MPNGDDPIPPGIAEFLMQILAMGAAQEVTTPDPSHDLREAALTCRDQTAAIADVVDRYRLMEAAARDRDPILMTQSGEKLTEVAEEAIVQGLDADMLSAAMDVATLFGLAMDLGIDEHPDGKEIITMRIEEMRGWVAVLETELCKARLKCIQRSVEMT